MKNVIILKKGEREITKTFWKNFQKGDTIFGLDAEPEELKRWPAEQKEEARKELAKYKSEYRELREAYDVTEYALEYCTVDEDGDFVDGSDYDMAEEAE